MFILNSEITINNITFKGVIELEISTSWELLTDTCKIAVPDRFTKDNKNITVGDDGFFKRGDAITVKLGYDQTLNTYFEGYISKITVDHVIRLECEDLVYLLKQNSVTKSYESVNLTTLIKDIAPDVESQVESAELGQLRLTNVTPAQILNELKKTYGLISFVRDNKLRVGLAYYPAEANTSTFDFERNIIENNLEYLKEDDVKIKVLARSILDDNTKIEVEAGDPDGATRTYVVYNVKDQAELKKLAEEQITRFKFTGYKGNFTTFLEPQVKHGDNVNIISRQYPERNGQYKVKSVNTTFGDGGGRQVIELDFLEANINVKYVGNNPQITVL
jgi:hypothetical protein